MKPHKVFVIGRNKTGTTSMKAALRRLGYVIGDQAAAELLLDDWGRRDFRRIVEYCKSADAFQDIPFSLGHTYKAVDAAFPGSKFVLTVRDSAEQWYESLVRFHTMIVGKNRVPTADDIKQLRYRRPGYMWQAAQLTYGIDENTLYDRRIYIEHYEAHNQEARDYFRDRPGDFLELNLASPGAMQSLCDFLGVDAGGLTMPHLNSAAAGRKPRSGRAGPRKARPDAPLPASEPFLAADLLERVKREDPELAGRLRADEAESLIQHVFRQMSDTVAGAPEGILTYAGLGQFHVRKNGRRMRIVFRPAVRRRP
jgi:hypothetical protein